PAGLAGDHVCLPDVVEQRGFAVVDVAHDRHDRRPRLQRLVRVLDLFGLGGGVLLFLDRLESKGRGDQLDHVEVEPLVDRHHLAQLFEGEGDDLRRWHLERARQLGDGHELRDPHQRLLALALFAPPLLLHLTERRPLPPPGWRATRHWAWTHGRGDERPRGRRRRRRKNRRRRGGGGRRRRKRQACRWRCRLGRFGGREILEQCRRALLERRRGLLFFLLAGGGLERQARDLGLGGFGGGDLGGRGIGRGDFRGGAAPPLGTAVAHGHGLRRRLDDLGRGAAPLGRRARLLLLALVALPARAHQRHLLVLERRQMTAHEDVHLLE